MVSFIKQYEKIKLSPHFNPLGNGKGSMMMAHSPSLGTKTRNISHFKKAHDVQHKTQPEDLTYEESLNPGLTLNGSPKMCLVLRQLYIHQLIVKLKDQRKK